MLTPGFGIDIGTRVNSIHASSFHRRRGHLGRDGRASTLYGAFEGESTSMVISDEPPFVFIHIPCTAGRSITEMLENHERNDTRRRIARNAQWGADYYHYTYEDLVHMGPRGWLDGRLIFSFVRNPWARMLSRYRYLRTWHGNNPARLINLRGYRPPGPISLEEWLCDGGPNGVHPLDMRPQATWITGMNGLVMANLVGRFETLRTDLDAITGQLGLDVQLSRGQGRSDDYRRHYTERARKRVQTLFADDIERFGYEF